MIRFMLDTDTCIYLIKRKSASIVGRLENTPIGQVGISSITMSELEYGVNKSRRRDRNAAALLQFLTPLEVLPYDDLAARDYGEIRAYLESGGVQIGALDMLIAAHARSVGCTLVTKNTGEFSRVPGLLVENWV